MGTTYYFQLRKLFVKATLRSLAFKLATEAPKQIVSNNWQIVLDKNWKIGEREDFPFSITRLLQQRFLLLIINIIEISNYQGHVFIYLMNIFKEIIQEILKFLIKQD